MINWMFFCTQKRDKGKIEGRISTSRSVAGAPAPRDRPRSAKVSAADSELPACQNRSNRFFTGIPVHPSAVPLTAGLVAVGLVAGVAQPFPIQGADAPRCRSHKVSQFQKGIPEHPLR